MAGGSSEDLRPKAEASGREVLTPGGVERTWAWRWSERRRVGAPKLLVLTLVCTIKSLKTVLYSLSFLTSGLWMTIESLCSLYFYN